jgi:hypothetical protein
MTDKLRTALSERSGHTEATLDLYRDTATIVFRAMCILANLPHDSSWADGVSVHGRHDGSWVFKWKLNTPPLDNCSEDMLYHGTKFEYIQDRAHVKGSRDMGRVCTMTTTYTRPHQTMLQKAIHDFRTKQTFESCPKSLETIRFQQVGYL